MRHSVIIIGVALLASGCAAESINYEQEYADRCLSQGYQVDTPDYDACIDSERQRKLIRRSAGGLY
ncbi:MAG: hypothetical protein ACREE7_05825 [Dongiaceae bacterium]